MKELKRLNKGVDELLRGFASNANIHSHNEFLGESFCDCEDCTDKRIEKKRIARMKK